ncbi:MAG: FAD-binding oxidoreductase, partial [Firmicutes bacterium]|nr:FAD-binding oxidoreductase [Bacillota bacterium]
MKRITDPEQMNLYLSDESRRVGTAQEIFFPETEEDICRLLQADKTSAVTTQGGRTGVTAGAVPNGGLVLNLSAMDRVLRLPQAADGPVSSVPSPKSVLVQPGVLLCHLQELLGRQHLFFPPDPTETTATVSGMVSCNSSGARTFKYGTTRDHILALRMVLSDGDALSIRRGECLAKAGQFSVETDGGRSISGSLPDIRMPQVSKHTAGYFIQPDMDMIDLFIGSEGTLGIITEIECSVLPEPRELWGTIIFFETEEVAIRFVRLLRGEQVTDPCSGGEHGQPLHPEAIEFFGEDTLDMLRESQAAGDMLTDMTEIPSGCAIYTEFASDSRSLLEPLCHCLGEMISQAGGDPDRSWFAFRGPDIKRLKDFRHAAPVCVNERISQIRKTHP